MANPIPGTMIVSDPWEQAFADYQQALVDLNGDGVPDAAVSPDGQMQPFRIGDQRKPMGLPRVAQPGMDVPKPSRQENIEGLTQLGLMTAGGPMLSAAGKAIQFAPRASGVAASLLPGFATLNSDEAEAQKAAAKGGAARGVRAPMTPQRDEQGILGAIGDNAALRSLYDQIKQAEARASSEVPGVNRDSSDQIRRQAASDAAELRRQLNAELLKQQQAKAPFRDTAIGQMWPYIQAGAPIVAGLAVKGGQNWLANRGPKALDDAVSGFEALRARGAPAGDLSYAAGKVGSVADDIGAGAAAPAGVGGWLRESAGSSLPATIAGGTFGAELNLLPYQYDRRNAPVGSPAAIEAENQLSGENWGRNALLGFGIGAFGGQTAAHLGHFGVKRAPMGEAENIRQYADVNKLAQRFAAEGDAVAQQQALAARQQTLKGIQNAAPPNVGFSDLELLTSSTIPRMRVGNVPTQGERVPLQSDGGATKRLPPPDRQGGQQEVRPVRSTGSQQYQQRPQDSGSGATTLKQSQRLDVQEQLLGGASVDDLARQYGVSKASISSIQRNTNQLVSESGGVDQAKAFLAQYRKVRGFTYAGAGAAATTPLNNLLALYGQEPPAY